MGLFGEDYACTICVLTQAADGTCQLLLQQPQLMPEFLRASYGHIPERQSWWSGLFGTKQRAAERLSAARHQFPQSSSHIHLDKAWHGIHFLLARSGSGEEVLAGFLLNGGAHLLASGRRSDDLIATWRRLLSTPHRDFKALHGARGPARVFRAAEVQAVHSLLRTIQWPDLKSRYDSRAMREVGIYPYFWHEDSGDKGPALYLRDHFLRLQEFVQQVAASGDGMIIHFCSASVFGSATRWH
jgi:hypothetical protein